MWLEKSAYIQSKFETLKLSLLDHNRWTKEEVGRGHILDQRPKASTFSDGSESSAICNLWPSSAAKALVQDSSLGFLR